MTLSLQELNLVIIYETGMSKHSRNMLHVKQTGVWWVFVFVFLFFDKILNRKVEENIFTMKSGHLIEKSFFTVNSSPIIFKQL